MWNDKHSKIYLVRKQTHHLLLRVREPGHLLPGHKRGPVGRLGPDERGRPVADRRHHAAVGKHLLHHALDARVVGEVDARPVPAGEEHRGVGGRVGVRELRRGRELGLRRLVRVEPPGVVRQVVVRLFS